MGCMDSVRFDVDENICTITMDRPEAHRAVLAANQPGKRKLAVRMAAEPDQPPARIHEVERDVGIHQLRAAQSLCDRRQFPTVAAQVFADESRQLALSLPGRAMLLDHVS